MAHHLADLQVAPEMQECIELCSDCHDACVATAAHCLERGGEHARPDHLRALSDCLQACDSARDFMLRGSELHPAMCGVCADACERCAESCETIGDGDEVMRKCADLCRRCAESCRAMASVATR